MHFTSQDLRAIGSALRVAVEEYARCATLCGQAAGHEGVG